MARLVYPSPLNVGSSVWMLSRMVFYSFVRDGKISKISEIIVKCYKKFSKRQKAASNMWCAVVCGCECQNKRLKGVVITKKLDRECHKLNWHTCS